MRPAAYGLAALALLAACGGGPSLPDEDLKLEVVLGAEEVVPGRAFPLTVVRAWRKDLEPSPWDDRALAPLVLRLEETARRADDRHVEETRRYRAYAFAREDVRVPAVKLTARAADGGPERSVLSPRRRLRVRPEVEATRPGPPELPGEPLAEPAPRLPWVLGSAIALALLAVAAWRLRRRPPAPREIPLPAATPPPPESGALARLGAIRERPGATSAARRSDVAEAADVLRDYVAARFHVPAPHRTTEELGATTGAAGMDAAIGARLTNLLARSDAVKFAGHAPTPAERDVFLGDAADFVAGTAAGASR